MHRRSPDGRTLAFLATEASITHSTCFKLCVCGLAIKSRRQYN
jgi:hypothetical protein